MYATPSPFPSRGGSWPGRWDTLARQVGHFVLIPLRHRTVARQQGQKEWPQGKSSGSSAPRDTSSRRRREWRRNYQIRRPCQFVWHELPGAARPPLVAHLPLPIAMTNDTGSTPLNGFKSCSRAARYSLSRARSTRVSGLPRLSWCCPCPWCPFSVLGSSALAGVGPLRPGRGALDP